MIRDGEETRSGLFFEFLRIIGELLPPWLVVENVPGLFSSNAGQDFQWVIDSIAERGYLLAWRVLDSRHFGVPQRRRRVYLVGSSGDRPHPAKVLFEREGVPGDIAAGAETGQEVAKRVGGGASGYSGAADQQTYIPEGARSLRGQSQGYGIDRETYVSGTTPDPDRVRASSRVPRRVDAQSCCSDGPRYAALGDAVTVNVTEWLACRIAEVETSWLAS
jgi:DNA (cytosine-5)-methyltransferase 1